MTKAAKRRPSWPRKLAGKWLTWLVQMGLTWPTSASSGKRGRWLNWSVGPSPHQAQRQHHRRQPMQCWLMRTAPTRATLRRWLQSLAIRSATVTRERNGYIGMVRAGRLIKTVLPSVRRLRWCACGITPQQAFRTWPSASASLIGQSAARVRHA